MRFVIILTSVTAFASSSLAAGFHHFLWCTCCPYAALNHAPLSKKFIPTGSPLEKLTMDQSGIYFEQKTGEQMLGCFYEGDKKGCFYTVHGCEYLEPVDGKNWNCPQVHPGIGLDVSKHTPGIPVHLVHDPKNRNIWHMN